MDLNSILEAMGNDSSNEEDKFYENLYEVIGCVPSSTAEQISMEYKKRVLHCHPDKVTDERDKKEAEKQFQNLSIAYKILVDEKERNYYDNWRNGSIKINYKLWRDLVVKKGHAVHWRPPPKKTLSIVHNSSTTVPTTTENKIPSGSRDDLYEKFRNYEI